MRDKETCHHRYNLVWGGITECYECEMCGFCIEVDELDEPPRVGVPEGFYGNAEEGA